MSSSEETGRLDGLPRTPEEPRELVRRNVPLILDSLAVADTLFARVQDLRKVYTELMTKALPSLEAMTTHEYVENKLVRPHREKIERLQREVRQAREQREAELRERTIRLLRSNVTLATCLRLVNTLKQQREFIEYPELLMKTFLEARGRFIHTLIEDTIIKRSHSDDMKQFEAVVRIMKEPVLEVITQFQAIFPTSHLLSYFVIERLDWFLDSLRVLVGRAKNTLVLASFWNQLVLLNAGYASVGASFLALAEDIFVDRAIQLIRVTAASSFKYLQGKLTPAVADMRPAAPTLCSGGVQSAGKDLRPAPAVVKNPALLLAANAFADMFEQVCMFAIPALRTALVKVIDEQIAAQESLLLQALGDATVELYRQELVPFVRGRVIEAYFGP